MKKEQENKTWDIWSEGYAITGNSGGAHFVGSIEAKTFEEACEKLLGDRLDRNPDGTLRYERPSIWACRLYDNERDARKSFG